MQRSAGFQVSPKAAFSPANMVALVKREVSREGSFIPCALAKRLLKPKATGDAVEDSERLAQWRAFQHLITHLHENPNKCLVVLSFAMMKKKGDGQGTIERWPGTSWRPF